MAPRRTGMSSALQARHRWTYSELVALLDDQTRHELIDGEHFVSPSPGTPHQLIVWNLVALLGPFLRSKPVGAALTGPVDVKLSPLFPGLQIPLREVFRGR